MDHTRDIKQLQERVSDLETKLQKVLKMLNPATKHTFHVDAVVDLDGEEMGYPAKDKSK